MPRDIDPGTIRSGSGLAADASIEANALIHPTASNIGLRAHILDPSRAHMAASIGLLDTAGHFLSDEVEGGMAELAASTAAVGTNGLLVGGTLALAAAPPTITLATPTTALHNGTEKDYSGQSLILPINTPVLWVYIDGATGVLTSNVAPPALATEPILLWRVATDATSVTTQVDARFFVPNIDRKVTYSVRDVGTATDRNSEGCFETLDAAFLWMEVYGPSSQTAKTEIVLRGPLTLLATYDIPVDGVTIRGEDGAQFIAGVALVPMFDLNGKNRVTFRDLEFYAGLGGCTAISDNGVAVTDLVVEDCQFTGSSP